MPKDEETQNVEMSPEDQLLQDIRATFDACAGQEEDAVKMAMIGSGASFKNVARLYNQFMIDAGLAVSKSDRDEILTKTLDGKTFETETDFDAAVALIVEAIVGSNDRSAGALVRNYAKKNDLKVYAKPKGVGKAGFTSKFFDFLKANPGCTKDEATAFIQGDGEHEDTSANTKRNESMYLGIWGLVNDIFKSNS